MEVEKRVVAMSNFQRNIEVGIVERGDVRAAGPSKLAFLRESGWPLGMPGSSECCREIRSKPRTKGINSGGSVSHKNLPKTSASQRRGHHGWKGNPKKGPKLRSWNSTSELRL